MELKKVGSDLITELKLRMQQQGYNISFADFAYWLEKTSPKATQRVLSLALDLLKPYAGGLGLFPVFQSDDEFEFEIKARPRNLNSQGQLHIGALIGAAAEMCELFLQRHGPVAGFTFSSLEQQSEFEKSPLTYAHLRLEWPAVERERTFLKLQKEKDLEIALEVLVFDRQQKYLGQIKFAYQLKYKPRLSYQKLS